MGSRRISTPAENNSVEQKYSRYVQGGDTIRLKNRLGWWERRSLPKADDDITYTLTAEDDRRPDIVAYKFYGRPTFAWLVLQYNNISDIETEFVAGKKIILPTERRVILDIMTKSPGGVEPEENQ